jgi:hypothetical protein
MKINKVIRWKTVAGWEDVWSTANHCKILLIHIAETDVMDNTEIIREL